METKRLFFGGLFAGISETDLKERLGKFGDVSNIELKTRKSDDGEPVKTFAHLDLQSTPDNLKKCKYKPVRPTKTLITVRINQL
jgi:hypothetical protein